ncbi:hypothetical protein D8B26_005227 [Coccidioides posadasii str. Silveira]|uniref:Uncharacterized protein n=3 Tax=Coccidioides posadasii TaxID=199306 RepID=E9D4L6_COCPS|nr:hypothetical protein CPC735_058240 [Coccidioides posadasii C735 delta SOWgp]EER24454.1 hypothetical protein CPC735_058240 [Coccidioides posadasii C735 delta SOWgp]EFW18448.1 hypothetical protein CPSG_05134 [Coccidioides posadasii str. Silveira]KMM66170.1 RRM domain-containing protein [Coccidioides posadasii RMSCC 3488]QVM10569.1 hypothetical protein D8B26_005227 [Coccidioides posadasii str. Silveira]|eukprot:XP_003066599.1 hypothetical protein CPC735_058240 [Coccidioides posadasii C735 delta SOWgp]
MATEDDNFDIDIYGDAGGYNGNENEGDYKGEEPELILDAPETSHQNGIGDGGASGGNNNATENGNHKIFKTEESGQPGKSASDNLQVPQQGVKRKESPTDRPTDPDATSALYISDLYWWTTDDEIRGWVNAAGCESELKDVTFSEHKVNGKSKGQAFVEFTSPQAATAAKHQIESLNAAQQSARKYSVNYTQPHTNPFRTLPKDNPMRGKDDRSRSSSAGFNSPVQGMNFGMGNTGGYRGGRGGGFNRGGMNMGGFNANRNFSNPMGSGGFQGGAMGGAGFQGTPVGGMQPYGGFGNRGGMMGSNMRGGPNMRGRGGMGGPMGGNMMPVGGMGGVGMGGMGMGGMGGMGGMPNQMGGMMGGMQGGMGMQGQGFQGQNPHFNPAFFGQHGGSDGAWNPHGAKRTRQE